MFYCKHKTSETNTSLKRVYKDFFHNKEKQKQNKKERKQTKQAELISNMYLLEVLRSYILKGPVEATKTGREVMQ